MYAIIRAGGKQTKVRSGDVIDIERVKGDATELTFEPLLVVDDDGNAVSDISVLAKAKVSAKVLGESHGPKIDIFKYKNKTGKVLATHPSLGKVTVEGVNIVKRHQKPNKAYPQGGIIELTKPIWVSKVALQDATTKKPTRISYAFDKDGKKLRISKATNKEIKL